MPMVFSSPVSRGRRRWDSLGDMTFEPIIRETEKPSLASYQQGLKVLRAATGDAVGPPDNHDFALLITAPGDATVRGGLWGQSRWGAFYVDMLVVPEGLRRTGLGTR